MKKIFSSAAFLLLFISAYSQSLTGTVKSPANEAIPYANVTVLNSNTGTATLYRRNHTMKYVCSV